MSKYVLSIDQGTTGTTAMLINKMGQVVASADQDFRQIFPRPGWVEHDPEDIWNTVKVTVEGVLRKANIGGHDIACIGITNQRETVVMWDKSSHAAIYNAIVWQCRRTTEFCDKLKKTPKARLIKKLTGLVVDPYFSASKINWLLKNAPRARDLQKSGDLACGTIDSFLVWRLSGGEAHATDVSNASRTQLMNLKTLKWDQKLLKIFSVPAEILPQILPSSGVFAKTKGLGYLPDGIPISGIAGDQQAALFGQTCFAVGEAKCTFGTGSFLLLNTGNKMVYSKAGMLTTVAWQINGKTTYAIEGGAFICGAAVQWLRDGLGIISSSSEVEFLAKTVDSSEGVEFVPALTGLGAPHWKAEARGMISGLTRGSSRAHIARATLEAMALQNTEILIAMQNDLGKKLKSIKVDGGATQNNLLMQLQTDYLGVPVVRPKMIETTSLGAAYLAGLGVGFWQDLKEIQNNWQVDQKFLPEISRKARTERLKHWQRAIARLD